MNTNPNPTGDARTMTAHEFFDRVLPQTGQYMAFELPSRKHHVFHTTAELAGCVGASNAFGVYHACGAYRSDLSREDLSREAKNVQALRSFWLDLDCGPTKDYPDQRSAIAALKSFCRAAKLPRPMVLDSGGGLHVYWPLTADVGPEDWKPVAAALKALCESHGLHADRNCTADAARILRPPGTLNRKYHPPREVRVVRDAEPVEFAAFKAAIEAVRPADTPPAIAQVNRNSAQIINLHGLTLDTNRRMIGEAADWPPTSENVARIRGYLDAVPADVGYDEWRDCVWAVASLDWGDAGRDLVEEWSRQSRKHWEDGGDEAGTMIRQLMDSFDPTRGITVGTLVHHARRHGYTEASRAVGSVAATGSTAEAPGKPHTGITFNLLTPDELESLPPLRFVVAGVLPETGLAAIYGPPGSGKTFLALDLAARIANGDDKWFGRHVRQRPVIYLALEGGRGLMSRCAAWKHTNGPLSPDFRTVLNPLFLNDARYVNALISALVATYGSDSGAVVFIDTLSKAVPGADENSAQEMGNALHSAELIARAVGGLVVLVHHSGKDGQRGLRGSSVLEGNIDAIVRVQREAGAKQRRWSIAKMKDGPDDASGGFDLDVVPLGTGEDGVPLTSCAVRPVQGLEAFKAAAPRGKHQTAVLEALRGHDGAGDGWARAELEEIAKDTLSKDVQSKYRADRAGKAVESLIGGGHLAEDDGVFHLPDHHPGSAPPAPPI